MNLFWTVFFAVLLALFFFHNGEVILTSITDNLSALFESLGEGSGKIKKSLRRWGKINSDCFWHLPKGFQFLIALCFLFLIFIIGYTSLKPIL